MKKALFLLLLTATIGYTQTTLPLIPQPKEIQMATGSFTINPKTFFVVNNADNNEVALFNTFLLTKYGYELVVQTKSKSPDNSITIFVQDPASKSEKYELAITPKHIDIKAPGNAGVFYAF